MAFVLDGNPASGTDADQYGNGFAQFYAMDPKAAAEREDGGYLDLSVDPDADTDDEADRLAAMANVRGRVCRGKRRR